MFKDLDPLLHSQIRLSIMSLLISVEQADFMFLKDKTESTAGNLSVQLDKLSKAGYVEITKGYRGRKPHTSCKITKQGIEAFEAYANALKSYIDVKT